MIGREYLDNFLSYFLVESLSTWEFWLLTPTVNSYFLIMNQ